MSNENENTEPSIWARLDLDTDRAGYTELWIQSAMINLEYMRANLERGNDDSAAGDIRKVKYALREAMCSIQGASCTVPSRTSIV